MQEESKVEITIIHGWGSSEKDHEIMRQIYADFEKEHPEIKLNMLSLPSDLDVIEKMRELLTVGKIPDIVFTAGEGKDTIYKFMTEHSYALDLMPYLEEDNTFKNNISPFILKEWTTTKNNLYTDSDVLLMGGYWDNRTLFEQAGVSSPPKTCDEFETVCQKIAEQRPNIKPILLDQTHIVHLTNAILHEEAPQELSNIENSSINLQSEGFQIVLNRLKNLSSYSDTVTAYSFRDTLESFNQQKTAIYINGIWGASLIDPKINVAYAPFPSDSGNSVAMISAGVGYILGNTGDEQRTNASVEFLKYMLSKPVGERLLLETAQIPSNPNVVITKDMVGERLYQALSCIKNAEVFIEFPANFWSRELQETYSESVISYLNNNTTSIH